MRWNNKKRKVRVYPFNDIPAQSVSDQCPLLAQSGHPLAGAVPYPRAVICGREQSDVRKALAMITADFGAKGFAMPSPSE